MSEIEAKLHDPNVLPHMYSEKDIEKLFPTIHAADKPKNADDFIPARRYAADIACNVDLDSKSTSLKK